MASASERVLQLINEQCGGSQQVFADRTGLTKGSVSQYVNGRNEPSKKTASKIAQEFGVSTEWVLGSDAAVTNATPKDNGEKKSMKREFGKSEKLDGDRKSVV